ncbi:MAG: hypothetical protein LBL58_19255 [Tannerellaceae bacterium]|jgi:hypothetical protein|nr:hypothetical protein [Tannerellaceae bacterium]
MRTISDKVQNITQNLIELGQQYCINKFTANIFYKKVDANDLSICSNFFEKRKKILQILTNGDLLSFVDIAKEIEIYQKKLLWLDFELCYVSQNIIVIIVVFVPKEMEDNTELKWHYCVPTPPDYKDKKQKFDANWQFTSWSARWKIFWWQHKIRFRRYVQ